MAADPVQDSGVGLSVQDKAKGDKEALAGPGDPADGLTVAIALRGREQAVSLVEGEVPSRDYQGTQDPCRS